MWIAEGGEAERDEWVDALRRAAASATGEAAALAWARRFAAAASVRDYVRELRAFAGGGPGGSGFGVRSGGGGGRALSRRCSRAA